MRARSQPAGVTAGRSGRAAGGSVPALCSSEGRLEW